MPNERGLVLLVHGPRTALFDPTLTPRRVPVLRLALTNNISVQKNPHFVNSLSFFNPLFGITVQDEIQPCCVGPRGAGTDARKELEPKFQIILQPL